MGLKKWQLLATVMTCFAEVVIAKPLQLSSKHSFSDKQILYHESNTQNTTYLYAVCDSVKKTEIKSCNVLLETDNFDGSNEIISCPVALPKVFGDLVYPVIEVVLVGQDKAAVFWTDENVQDYDAPEYKATFYLNIVNIHMRNGCRKIIIRTELPVRSAPKAINVMPFEDTYDVVLPEALCDNKTCKGTFDVNGTVIANVSSWDPLGKKFATEHLVNLIKHSRKVGYLTVGFEKDEIQFIFIKDDAKVLKTWNTTEYFLPEVKYSFGYDTLGACLLYGNDNINCTFFNFNGTVKQEASFRSDHKHFHFVHNLPGGFLTITKDCLVDEKFITPRWMCPHNLNYFVTRYDAQSKQVKKIEIKEHNWDNHDAFDIFKNSAGEHCVTITNYEVLKSLQVHSYCFPDF